MDRRAKKLEKKRKERKAAKQKSRATELRRAALDRELFRTAASADFGPCWISDGWDGLSEPALVNVVVTRKFPNGRYLPLVVLVDRTCLGVKDAFIRDVCSAREFGELIEELADVHGGMHECELLLAQSIVFHGVDYAARLGFAPAEDFPAELFGARPAQLLETPWRAADKPYYVAGPHDDVRGTLAQLRARLGDGGFDYFLEVLAADGFDEDDEDGDWVVDTDGETVVPALSNGRD